jgi:hypothetical protein
MWPLYIRVLDARNEGATYEEIGRTLTSTGESFDEMSQTSADAALNALERAKSDAKKWHVAALLVANNGPF